MPNRCRRREQIWLAWIPLRRISPVCFNNECSFIIKQIHYCFQAWMVIELCHCARKIIVTKCAVMQCIATIGFLVIGCLLSCKLPVVFNRHCEYLRVVSLNLRDWVVLKVKDIGACLESNYISNKLSQIIRRLLIHIVMNEI